MNLLHTTKAIVGMIHRHRHGEIQAIGRAAVPHAKSAIARATLFLEEENITIVNKTRNIKPGMDGNEKEGIRFILRVVEDTSPPPGPEGSTAWPYATVLSGPFEGKSLSGFTLPAGSRS